MRALTLAVLLSASGFRLTAQQPVAGWDSTAGAFAVPIPPAARLVAITNATVLTASHGTIEKATILIRDGKIAAVGANVSVPQGADVIDYGMLGTDQLYYAVVSDNLEGGAQITASHNPAAENGYFDR